MERERPPHHTPAATTIGFGAAPPAERNPAPEAEPDIPTRRGTANSRRNTTDFRRNTRKRRDDTSPRFAQHSMATPRPTVGNPSPTHGRTIDGLPASAVPFAATRTGSSGRSAFASSIPGTATAFAANAIT